MARNGRDLLVHSAHTFLPEIINNNARQSLTHSTLSDLVDLDTRKHHQQVVYKLIQYHARNRRFPGLLAAAGVVLPY